MKSFLCFTLVLVCLTTLSFGQHNLEGFIYDTKSDDPLIGVNIVLSQDGIYKYGTVTDLEGMYNLKVETGTYDLKFTYIGYPEKYINDIVISKDQPTVLDIEMEAGIELEAVIVTCYRVPSIDQSGCIFSQTISCSSNCYPSCDHSKISMVLPNEQEEVSSLRTTTTSIYPNPASQKVTLEATEVLKRIRVFTLDGKLIFQQEKLNQTKVQFPVNHWTAGMYWVYYEFKNQTEVKKLIVESDH